MEFVSSDEINHIFFQHTEFTNTMNSYVSVFGTNIKCNTWGQAIGIQLQFLTLLFKAPFLKNTKNQLKFEFSNVYELYRDNSWQKGHFAYMKNENTVCLTVKSSPLCSVTH